MLSLLSNLTISASLAGVTALGALVPRGVASPDLRGLLERDPPGATRAAPAASGDVPDAPGSSLVPDAAFAFSPAELRQKFPECGPAVDRFEAAFGRVVDALAGAEDADDFDSILWDLSEEFEVAYGAINFALAVSRNLTVSSILMNDEALKAQVPASMQGTVVGGILVRLVDATLKLRQAMPIRGEALAATLDSEFSDETGLAATFGKMVEATRSVFAPRYLRNMLSGQHRVFVGLMALDAMPAQAPAVLAFLEEALRDYESSADTVTNETLRQQDELAVAALQGRMERLAEEAEQRADEAVDGLVTIPFLRPEDDARWQADAQRGLDAQRRGPPTDET